MPSPNNSNYVAIKGLRDIRDNSIINGATVTVTVYDSVPSVFTGPVTMTYISGSRGDYDVTLSDTLPWVVGDVYTYEYTATYNGLKLQMRCTETATENTCGC